MKKFLITSSIFLAVGLSFAQAECFNCSAEVVIRQSQAKQFSSTLLTMNSMPLTGHQIPSMNQDDYVVIQVETYQEYAQENHITSFDVAKILETSFGSDSKWGIKKITAAVENFNDESLSNVGTIGH